MNFKKGLALFLCLAILLSSGAGAAFASVKISAKLISMDGDVQVIRAGGEKPFKAFVNMRLTEGDRIITGSNGTAKVQMEDDVIITLAENTRIYLSELRGSQGAQQSSINLQSGAVGSSVGKKLTDNSRFEIKTPTAVMGVRGTEFFTQYYNGNVDVRVVNGTVEVSVSVTSTGNIAGPGATAVQTYTFPVTSLQQINFGQETPLSQLQQPPQPLGLIGLPLPFLDRVQEINQQVPGTIPQNIINTIDQAVESARISIQNRMDNPNIVPSELESFIAGRIEGSLFPGLPNFGLPAMLIMPPPPPPPPPPSFFPGGGGPTVDFGGDDGGTTPIFVDFYMHREMEVEIVEETQLVTYFDVTLTFNRSVNANSLIDNGFMVEGVGSGIISEELIGTIGENPNQVLLSRLTLMGPPGELEDSIFVVTAPSGIRDTQNNYINGNRIAIHGADPAGSVSITSITPNSQLVPGEVTDFTVTVAYSFANINQAELGIGFNTEEDINIFNMVDDASQVVTNSSGTHTFEVSSMVKDWGEDGDFKVYVNISEADHDSSWTPLDSDEMVLGVQSIDDTLTINGIIREGGTANGLEEVEIKIYSGHPVYNDVIAGPIYSDSSGNYTIAGIPEGTGYYIFFAKDGWVSFGEALNIETGQQELNLNNSMTPTGNGIITGRIVDSPEHGIQDVNVSLYYNNQIYPDQYLSVIVNTNEFGEYELRNIKFLEQVPEDGLYKIRFERSGYEVVEIEVSSENYSVNPEIPNTINMDYFWEEPMGYLYGTVTQFASGDTMTLEGVSVTMLSDTEESLGETTTYVDGMYYFENAPLNEEVNLSFSLDNYLTSLVNPITVTSGEYSFNKSLIPSNDAGYLVLSQYGGSFIVSSAPAYDEMHLTIEYNIISSPLENLGITLSGFLESMTGTVFFPSGVEVIVKDSTGTITKENNDIVVQGDQMILRHLDTGLTRTYTITEAPVTP